MIEHNLKGLDSVPLETANAISSLLRIISRVEMIMVRVMTQYYTSISIIYLSTRVSRHDR